MDVLADILDTLELRSELYFRARFHGAFAVAVPADAERIRFHVGGAGRCWVGLQERVAAPDGSDGLWLDEGDLVLVPHGAAHVLADAPTTPAVPLPDVLQSARASPPAGIEVGAAAGAPTVLVCGHFAFATPDVHPMLAALPPLVPLRRADGRSFDWLDATLRHLQDEMHAGRPGYGAVVRRLCEVVLVEVLRLYAERAEEAGAPLAALRDPQLRRALEALHADPARAWTLDRLAALAGMSRTVFTERFRKSVGTSPMHYLADWRMQKARRLLEREALSVGEVARAVGYASEAAFNRGFKGRYGVSPGKVRRRLAGAAG